MGRKRIAQLKSENKQSFKVSVEHLTGVTSVPSLPRVIKLQSEKKQELWAFFEQLIEVVSVPSVRRVTKFQSGKKQSLWLFVEQFIGVLSVPTCCGIQSSISGQQVNTKVSLSTDLSKGKVDYFETVPKYVAHFIIILPLLSEYQSCTFALYQTYILDIFL